MGKKYVATPGELEGQACSEMEAEKQLQGNRRAFRFEIRKSRVLGQACSGFQPVSKGIEMEGVEKSKVRRAGRLSSNRLTSALRNSWGV